MTDFDDHPKGCDCIFCEYPFLKDHIVEDTGPVKLMEAFVSSTKSEARFFGNTQPRVAHWSSSAMKPCERLAWFQQMGTPPTNVGFSEDILDKGIDSERRSINLYRSFGEMSGQRMYVGEGTYVTIIDPRLKLPITGKIDLLILEGDKWVPVELKETKDFGGDNRYCYKCRNLSFGSPTAWHKFKPSLEYISQLALYMHAYRGKVILNRQFADYGYLHYRNRNTSGHLRYKFTYSEKLIEEIITYFQKLETVFGQLTPPDIQRGITKDKFPCAWKQDGETVRCAFWNYCWTTGTKVPEPTTVVSALEPQPPEYVPPA
jgi:hypothetical protein